jgi:hypothetical protein
MAASCACPFCAAKNEGDGGAPGIELPCVLRFRFGDDTRRARPLVLFLGFEGQRAVYRYKNMWTVHDVRDITRMACVEAGLPYQRCTYADDGVSFWTAPQTPTWWRPLKIMPEVHKARKLASLSSKTWECTAEDDDGAAWPSIKRGIVAKMTVMTLLPFVAWDAPFVINLFREANLLPCLISVEHPSTPDEEGASFVRCTFRHPVGGNVRVVVPASLVSCVRAYRSVLALAQGTTKSVSDPRKRKLDA